MDEMAEAILKDFTAAVYKLLVIPIEFFPSLTVIELANIEKSRFDTAKTIGNSLRKTSRAFPTFKLKFCFFLES